MKVPFIDLKTQYESLREEISVAIGQVLDDCAYAGGPYVTRFEKDFADFCGVKEAVGVSSGTEALWLALQALGIGRRDEVITVPNTFFATAEAITRCGAIPVFVDIDEASYNMNPSLLRFAITPKTKAIIPVHLFGQTADMDPIMEIAKKHRLYVIEDACQAHGALYKGKPAGTIGDMGCFSFYPGKNLGAYGEAGAVVTNSPEMASLMRIFRDHGQVKKYYHRYVGWNSRMHGLQGAILSVKLKYLKSWNEKRRENAHLYGLLLESAKGVRLPAEMDYGQHIYHVYAIRTKNRDALMDRLGEKEIQCNIHYPVPVHLQTAYGYLGYKPGSFPVAERCCAELVSLPMYPELAPEQIGFVADQVRLFQESLSQKPAASDRKSFRSFA